MKVFKRKSYLFFAFTIASVLLLLFLGIDRTNNLPVLKGLNQQESQKKKKNYIKWVDFNVAYEALDQAYRYDVELHDTKTPVHWIELLAYLGAKYGGDFSSYQEKDMCDLVEKLKGKETIKTLTKDMKYYKYYYEVYSAVLGGYVGEYELAKDKTTANIISTESINKKKTKKVVFEKHYGLKAFLPIAKGFGYCEYDDFGVSRSYGYNRPHLGHDMMGLIGTPIIAVESGYVEAIGWNQYGGWRLGIRSFDKKRYYYYAHLRQNAPYAEGLKEGSIVTAGDVIGYMGHTGYSAKENVNNIDCTHLHFGIQLIFDESQKEGNNEIWIDCYALTRFLSRNSSETVKVGDSKEWVRVYELKDPVVENYIDKIRNRKKQRESKQ